MNFLKLSKGLFINNGSRSLILTPQKKILTTLKSTSNQTSSNNNQLLFNQNRSFAMALKSRKKQTVGIVEKKEGEESTTKKEIKDPLFTKTYAAMKVVGDVPRILPEKLKELLSSNEEPQLLLIDLRDSRFLDGEPLIQSSINIPVSRVTDPNNRQQTDAATIFLSDVLNMPDVLWKSKYKCVQPTKGHYIVFISSTGVRSEVVTKKARQMGFEKTFSLHGGSRLWDKYYVSK